MLIHTAHEVARAAQQQRHRLGWSQSLLAERIGATRQWVMAFEGGKPRVELGLVLRALGALGLLVDIAPIGAHGAPGGSESASPSTRAEPGLLSAPRRSADTPLADPRPSRRRDHVPSILTLSRAAAADPARIVNALTQPASALTESASSKRPASA